jgi:hypothetical protein
MPLPAYLICSEGVSIDKDANKVTLFNVSEQIGIIPKAQLEQAGLPASPLLLRIISVWMREDNDPPDIRFENQFVLHFPQTAEMIVSQAEFSFLASARFHRIFTQPIFVPGVPGPGLLKIESRLRRTGDADWLHRQFFYIELSAIEVAMLLPVAQPPSANT